jgi:acetylornithine deacetylase
MGTSLTDRDLLGRLVGFDTTTHLPTTDLFDFVCEYLDLPEIRCDRFDCGDGHENVWFETGPPTESGEGVLLCGHVDTVPAGEPDWTSDPRILTERDGRLHARGACDMKGFDALAINIIRNRAESGHTRPLALLLTHSEETGTIGAGQFADAWDRSRALPQRVIVGEPTSLSPVRGHKGHLSVEIVVGGTPCHTGYPDQGDNAILHAMPLFQAIEALRQAMHSERTDASDMFVEVPQPVLNLVRIDAGKAVNIMPETCRLVLGARLLPGQSSDAFIQRLHQTIASSGLVIADRPAPGSCTVRMLNNTPSFGTPADDPFLEIVCRHAGADRAIGVSYGTDAGRLEALGCRSVVFGPGDIAQAHRADEWMPMDEFERAPALLEAIIDEASH